MAFGRRSKGLEEAGRGGGSRLNVRELIALSPLRLASFFSIKWGGSAKCPSVDAYLR
jgi:hypothetical protein